MISRSPLREDRPDWRRELSEAYSDPLELLRMLELDSEKIGYAPAAARLFPFRVTRYYANLIEPRTPADPLLLQILPQTQEMLSATGFEAEPLAESRDAQGNSLLAKYQQRVLLMVSGACAIHCRYCFRRSFPYNDFVGHRRLSDAITRLEQDPEIKEVILSGGDPLVIDDAALGELVRRLEAVPHVSRLRIHSRLPVVLPSRLTPGLLEVLRATRLRTVLVLHINHPHEVTLELADALIPWRQSGLTLLNQAVLLRGVNDDPETLEELSEKLFDAGVLPYYVHLLDRVSGSAHFEVTDARAREIETDLRTRLPGYLMPRFVREVNGEPYKVPLAAT